MIKNQNKASLTQKCTLFEFAKIQKNTKQTAIQTQKNYDKKQKGKFSNIFFVKLKKNSKFAPLLKKSSIYSNFNEELQIIHFEKRHHYLPQGCYKFSDELFSKTRKPILKEETTHKVNKNPVSKNFDD